MWYIRIKEISGFINPDIYKYNVLFIDSLE